MLNRSEFSFVGDILLLFNKLIFVKFPKLSEQTAQRIKLVKNVIKIGKKMLLFLSIISK